MHVHPLIDDRPSGVVEPIARPGSLSAVRDAPVEVIDDLPWMTCVAFLDWWWRESVHGREARAPCFPDSWIEPLRRAFNSPEAFAIERRIPATRVQFLAWMEGAAAAGASIDEASMPTGWSEFMERLACVTTMNVPWGAASGDGPWERRSPVHVEPYRRPSRSDDSSDEDSDGSYRSRDSRRDFLDDCSCHERQPRRDRPMSLTQRETARRLLDLWCDARNDETASQLLWDLIVVHHRAGQQNVHITLEAPAGKAPQLAARRRAVLLGMRLPPPVSEQVSAAMGLCKASSYWSNLFRHAEQIGALTPEAGLDVTVVLADRPGWSVHAALAAWIVHARRFRRLEIRGSGDVMSIPEAIRPWIRQLDLSRSKISGALDLVQLRRTFPSLEALSAGEDVLERLEDTDPHFLHAGTSYQHGRGTLHLRSPEEVRRLQTEMAFWNDHGYDHSIGSTS